MAMPEKPGQEERPTPKIARAPCLGDETLDGAEGEVEYAAAHGNTSRAAGKYLSVVLASR